MRLARLFIMTVAAASGGCEIADPGDLFDRGMYEDARRGYRQALAEDPGSPIVHYDLGATGLRLGEYEEARPHLELAAGNGDRLTRQWALYNLGNGHLEPVFRDLEAERAAALARAILAYKRALLLNPNDQDAKWNLELARRLLEEELRSPRPRRSPSEGGGGGGGGEGGGGASDLESGGGAPQPSPASAGAGSPRLSRAEAERILDSAEQRELAIQREKLTRPQPPTTSH